MKFRLIILILFISSCSPHLSTFNQKINYAAKGFAYIYNDNDFNNKIIKGKMNNQLMQISHQNLRTGTLVKISNPKNSESIVLKNIKRIKYPDFYKILITKPVAEKLNLDTDLPILEIIEIKKISLLSLKKLKYIMKKKKYHQKRLLLLFKFQISQKIK